MKSLVIIVILIIASFVSYAHALTFWSSTNKPDRDQSPSAAAAGVEASEGGSPAFNIEVPLLLRKDDYLVTIEDEEGYTLCQQRIHQKDHQKIESCPFDVSRLRPGDNVFRVTVTSLRDRQIVLQTTDHYYHTVNDDEVRSRRQRDKGESYRRKRLLAIMQSPLLLSTAAIGGAGWFYYTIHHRRTRRTVKPVIGEESSRKSDFKSPPKFTNTAAPALLVKPVRVTQARSTSVVLEDSSRSNRVSGRRKVVSGLLSVLGVYCIAGKWKSREAVSTSPARSINSDTPPPSSPSSDVTPPSQRSRGGWTVKIRLSKEVVRRAVISAAVLTVQAVYYAAMRLVMGRVLGSAAVPPAADPFIPFR
eukprot:gene2237-2446_t